MIQVNEVVQKMNTWISSGDKGRYIIATGMHGVMEARRDPEFKTIMNSSDLMVPDGISLVLVGRCRGFHLPRRVTGTDLMSEFCKQSASLGYKNFFYGDTEETLRQLVNRLKKSYPNLQIAGTYSPPFRPPTPDEETEQIELINRSGTDVIWVGLGLPKQEQWIYEHRHHLNASVLVGVGAAFKFASGRVEKAPSWVGNNGFEWLWRFAREPRRVWRRVIIDGPSFVGQVLLEMSGLKKYD